MCVVYKEYILLICDYLFTLLSQLEQVCILTMPVAQNCSTVQSMHFQFSNLFVQTALTGDMGYLDIY